MLTEAAALACILLNATPVIGICLAEGMACHHTALVVNILSALAILASPVAIARARGGEDRPRMGL